MRAEILTVGAELLAGDTLDTNFPFAARRFAELGIEVIRHQSLPDREEAIAEAVRGALERADVVLVTGGLGPTPDDRTREGVAQALGLKRILYEELRPALEARFAAYGKGRMPKENLTQITLPEGSMPLPNPAGTAPGFRLERDGAVLFVLPGVPREMQALLEEAVVPWLRSHRPVRARPTRVLRTQGIGESQILERFGEAFRGLEGVEVGFYPKQPGVDIKLVADDADPAAAGKRLDEAERRLCAALGEFVYGTGSVSLAEVVGRLLLERGARIAVAESCTGGALAAELLSVPGASRYVECAVVAYSNRAKSEWLGVPAEQIERHGAVSEEVARAMAGGVRDRAGVEVAVSTTGIAGPSGGTAEKPVGLVYSAVAVGERVRVYRSRHPGSREAVVRRAVMTDLNRLRLALREEAGGKEA